MDSTSKPQMFFFSFQQKAHKHSSNDNNEYCQKQPVCDHFMNEGVSSNLASANTIFVLVKNIVRDHDIFMFM